jgi:hypothetical protein
LLTCLALAQLGLDGAKLADTAYVKQIMRKFIAKLETARTALRH